MIGCIILVFFGTIFSITGIVLFYRHRGEKEGQINKIKLFGLEAEVASSSLFLSLIGAGMIVYGVQKIPDDHIEDSRKISKAEVEQVEKIVKEYFDICKSQKYDQLKWLYARRLERFYNMPNPSPDDVIKEQYRFRAKRKIIPLKYDIDFKTLEIVKVFDGYQVSFKMLFSADRSENNMPRNFDLKIFMKLNDVYKITSLHETILNQW